MMTFGNLLTCIVTCIALANAYRYVDCFDNLPTGWSFEGEFDDQAKFGCLQRCELRNSKYFAISSGYGNQCYCGDELPINSQNNIGKEEVYGRSSSSYSLFSVIGTNDEKFYRRDDGATGAAASPQQSVVESTAVESEVITETSGSSDPTNTSPSSGSAATPTITSTGSGSTGPQSRAGLIPSTTTNANHETSVVYHTSIRTQSGSKVIRTVTQSATPSAAPNQDKNDKKHHHDVNVGAIVGGVVGGVGGAAVATILLLLLIRHLNKRREQERMEEEYQEAIKPVDFGSLGNRGGSTGGASGYTGTGFTSTNNGSDKAPQLANTSVHSLNQGPSSGSFDDDVRSGVGQNTNPFDDSRRISNPSFMRSESPSSHKILTVVNPDEED